MAGAQIRSGASTDLLTIDATSKAARITLYDSTGRQLSLHSKLTYAASGSFTPAATPNDLVIIYGSASKTVRVISFKLGTQNTSAGSQTFFVHKKSSLPSGGTFVAATAVPLDSSNAAATATNIGHYTVDPTAGASAGTINTMRVASTVLVPGSFAGVQQSGLIEMLPIDAWGMAQPVTLRGVAEGIGINFNDAALVSGQVHHYTIVWIEE